ncbi:MAG TPA: precorrin-6A synthase (deacetylating) [Streptosporangiaceae bacterium]|nr:precorrin-6A synthase (deacetylating) [Streptosporangiaceae bacterium]
MRTVSVVGIGAGNPEHITVQAISTLNAADVVFMTDKGDAAPELTELRRAVCERYITGSSYRIVTAADPDRDRGTAAYEPAVDDWRTRRAVIYERLIASELGEQGRGAFLAWGDPAIYDSTVHVLGEVLARGAVTFEIQVIPGISSVQALAAQHKTSLTRTGRPVHITTGRLLAQGLPSDADDVVVMLDAGCTFTEVGDGDLEIYWGAYIGSKDEVLISGRIAEVGEEITAARAAARRRHGWIMDTYLLRRPDST